MADSLSTIGSIASYITTSLQGLPIGVSGNCVQMVDLARQYVAQFTGQSIGSNSIPENYQSAIVDFAMANVMSMVLSTQGGTDLALGELKVSDGGVVLTPEQYRLMGEMKLKLLGRHISFARVLS
jgi:hypothetical protein